MRKFVLLAVCILTLPSLQTSMFGQATDANLVGTVLDASGAAVPGATVDVTNVDTGVRSSTTTKQDGTYRFNNILIGRYDVQASASGFTAAALKNVTIELNKTATANLTLQLGTLATTVDVTEAPAVIDTTTAQVQSNFDARQIVNMPIIENSGAMYGALNLSLLSAGVTSNGGVGQGTGPSVGGQRPMNNNFNVEGVDNNSKTVTGPLVYVPTEATAEFTLLQNQFAPEFGHSSGGQFNTVVKSGSNNVHGSLYEYMQNRHLNAVDESFARQGIRENPRFDQNRLGASIGGPIFKNKLFYFGNFEFSPFGQGFTLGSPILSPTAAGYAKLDALSGISQTNYSILKKYLTPAPQQTGTTPVTGVDIPIGILPINGAVYTNQYVAVASIDYNISQSDNLRGRFIHNTINTLDNNPNLPIFYTTQPNKYYLLSLAEFHNFSPNVTNELRLAYNRFNQTFTISNFQFPGLDRFPNIQIDNDLGVQIGPDPNAPQFTIQNTYQLVENVNWTKSKHTFKFGFDGRKMISPQRFIQRERGDYNWSTLENYLLDTIPDDLSERNVGDTIYYGDQVASYVYGNDNWRIRPNFSLNLGLRYEFTTVPYTQRLQKLNAISNVPGLIEFNEPRPQKKNFAPRIGFAYSPGASGNTSIRAGFGMAYDVIFDNVGSTAYPPQLSSTIDTDPNDPATQAFYSTGFLKNGGILPNAKGSGALSQAAARDATSSYLPDQKLPYSIQWNFGVQHVFARNYTFEARYLGTRGVHLLVQSRLNRLARVTADRNLPTYLQAPSQDQLDALPNTLNSLLKLPTNSFKQYGFNSNVVGFMPIGNSNYHGLALQLNRRFSNGLQAISSYTWSHNIDDSTATHFATILTPRRPQDFQNLRADRASSALDRRHRFTVNWIYEVPWFKNSGWFAKNIVGNWRWVATYTAESPEYATVQSGTDSNLNGDAWPDRAIINPAGDPNRGSDVTALKNSSGQTVAYLAKDTTARYIKAGRGAYANGGRNTLATRGINNWDLSFGKKFSFTESKSLEFRGDFSNFFNHPQYTTGYINSVRLTTQTTTRVFLLPDNPQFANWSGNFPSNARSVQLAARFVF